MATVIIDYHEPVELNILLDQLGVLCIRKRLVPGDILVNNVLIERKTLNDFATSLKQQRLFEQLDRLRSVSLENEMCPCMVLETPTYEFSPSLVFLMTKIQLDMQVPIMISSSLEGTA